MDIIFSPQELEVELGENVKTLRLQKNIDRQTFCKAAGVSESALRNQQAGRCQSRRWCRIPGILAAASRDSSQE